MRLGNGGMILVEAFGMILGMTLEMDALFLINDYVSLVFTFLKARVGALFGKIPISNGSNKGLPLWKGNSPKFSGVGQ